MNAGWGDKFCLAHCSANSDCGSNGICESNVCLDKCTDDSQCHNDFRCSPNSSDGSGPTYCLPDMRGLSCQRTVDCNDPKMTCVGTAGLNTDQHGICTADCSKDASICGDNATCLHDVCVLACKSDNDCAAHEHCSSGGCIYDVSTTLRPIGAACDNSNQCKVGLTCLQDGFTLGYCTRFCSGAADCPGEACIMINDTSAVCMNECYVPGEQDVCRDGYSCLQVKDQSYGICYPK